MATTLTTPDILTPEEYLEIERRAERKSEYVDGNMYVMPGATGNHVDIVFDIVLELGQQLRNSACRIRGMDMRVRSKPGGPYYYPDVLVVCGEPEYEDTKNDTLLNPKVIIEVLSPTTQRTDRGEKLYAYRDIPSLTEYLLVAQNHVLVDHYVLQSDGNWVTTRITNSNATIELPTVGAKLKVADIYRRVKFDNQ